jgi:hypothetical protein
MTITTSGLSRSYKDSGQSISARASALVTKPASPMPYLRIAALQRMIVDRYGEPRLPDSDEGRDILRPMADHLAQINPARIRRWAAAWMPGLPAADVDDLITSREALIAECGKTALYWNADALAHEVELDDAARTRTRGWSIGAVDCDKAEREKRRKIKRADAARAKRAAAGATPRAQSITATQQWIKDGFNTRRTWERHGKRPRVANSRPAILSSSMPVTNLRHEESIDTTTGTDPERAHGAEASTVIAKPLPSSFRVHQSSDRAKTDQIAGLDSASYGTPQSVVDAFFYVLRTKDAAGIAEWLAAHPQDKRYLQKIWEQKCSTAAVMGKRNFRALEINGGRHKPRRAASK